MSERSVGEHMPIEPNRRLVIEGQGADGLEEYKDMLLNQRIISLPAGSPQQEMHLALESKGLPVFPHQEVSGDMHLAVPEGSRSLRHILRIIARDVSSYRFIFTEVGTVMRQMEEGDFGLPRATSAHGLMGAFAYSLDDQRSNGGGVFLAPPYNFDKERNLKNELNELPFKLTRTGVFDQESVASVVSAVREGANYGDGEQ
jgi:hypothetical protein